MANNKKMKILNVTLVLLAIIISSCNAKKNTSNEKTDDTIVDMHNSMNSIDWNGTYQATLPCADCEGIQTVLTLNEDLTYVKKSKYLDKEELIIEDKGSFTWDKTGQIITLNNDEKNQYFVGENRIWMLDQDTKKVTGSLAEHYILNKQTLQITDRHWKLVELNGQKVEYDKKSGNQPYIILRPNEDNKVYGYAGCNRFFGNFEIKEGGQISFLQMGATKMYCPDMKIEDEFFKVLNTADNFSLSGEIMTLNKAKMAPLAKFEVAYFQ